MQIHQVHQLLILLINKVMVDIQLEKDMFGMKHVK